MKRVLGAIMSLVLLAGLALPASAQTCRCRYTRRATQYSRYSSRYNRSYSRYDNSRRVYYAQRYRGRSFWDKHRDKLTLAMGTGAGALIGGLAGGKRGAGIGALLGAGGSALYTYKLRNRRVYYRR